MAIDVLNKIKVSEEKAAETRRVAAIAAKESLKLAEQENTEIKDKELTKARQTGIHVVEEAQRDAKAELDALQEQRIKECEKLKQDAEKKLSQAADVCIERILR